MLNEACNKAQKASVPSAAVMLLIKEHRQDLITGHTLGVYPRLTSFGTDALECSSWLLFISHVLNLKQKLTACLSAL